MDNIENKEFNLRLQNTKYKVYIFFILVFSYIFWSYFNATLVKIDDLNVKINKIDSELSKVYTQLNDVKYNDNIIQFIWTWELQLVDCINTKACSEITWAISDNLDIVRNYMLLSQLDEEKMEFNQKLLLQSISDYLLITKWWNANWELNIVSFGMPSQINMDYSLYRLPISLNIDFENEKKLLLFLKNVEDLVNVELPVLYKVNSINYDIVNYDKPQSVSVSMEAYFYK